MVKAQRIIGGAPTVLDRRRAAPLIGGAVCNCLIGCAESFFVFGFADSEGYLGATGLRVVKG